MKTPAYATLVLDVDSTLCGIEGVDWLAQRRGDIVARSVANLTDEAMRGAIPLENVFGARLAAIKPRRDDLDALSRAYVEALAPGAMSAIAMLRRAGVHIVLVSGGLRHALIRLSFHLGMDIADLHAVDVYFDAVGAYTGFDQRSPLTTSYGKRAIVQSLNIARPALAVGDGVTDLAMGEVVDRFVAFTGFAARPAVVAKAGSSVDSFDDIVSLILG